MKPSKPWSLPVNLWKRLDVLPPCAVRLLAKKGNDLPLSEQAMSDEEIAAASGLAVPVVRLISHRLDWHGIELMHAREFLKACGADPTNAKDMIRVRDYLSGKPKWKYLKYSPHFHTTLKPLMKLYAGLYERSK